MALQSDAIYRQLIHLWVFFTITLTKYHGDKYIMCTLSLSVTAQWWWGLNTDYCQGWKLFKIPKNRGSQISQKYKNHLKIQSTRMVTLSKFHVKDPQILGITVQNLFAQVSWHMRFVHHCPKMYLQLYGVQWLVASEELKASALHLGQHWRVNCGMPQCLCKKCDLHVGRLNIYLFVCVL